MPGDEGKAQKVAAGVILLPCALVLLPFLMMEAHSVRKGFSLIELFIVVTIMGVLTVVAIPNFLRAQHCSRIARCSADLRMLATAIEAYRTENGAYVTPRTDKGTFAGPSLVSSSLAGTGWVSYRYKRLTTPIAFITTVPGDPFNTAGFTGSVSANYDSYDYWEGTALSPTGTADTSTSNWRGAGISSGAMWRMAGTGPDLLQTFGGGTVQSTSGAFAAFGIVDYDPTNGMVSKGDIVRIGGGAGPINTNPGLWPAIDRVQNQYNVTIP